MESTCCASHGPSDTTEKVLCGSAAPVTRTVFKVSRVQLQPIRLALKQLILFQGYLFSVNIFQRMQADGITCKAIVLVLQEKQQHLESIQKLPTRDKTRACIFNRNKLNSSKNKTLGIFQRLLRCVNLCENLKYIHFP